MGWLAKKLHAISDGDYVTQGRYFDGINDYATRTPTDLGIGEGPTGTLSVWIKSAVDGTLGVILCNAGNANAGLYFAKYTTNVFYLRLRNSGPAIIVSAVAGQILSSDGWVHFLASWDTANLKFHWYRNDVSISTIVPSSTTNVDYDYGTWAIGDENNGGGRFNGDMSELYFSTDYIDLTVEANRRKFISSTRKPVSLGLTGSLPTGNQPLIYFPYGDPTDNHGTGGNFTMTGALDVSSSSPSDPDGIWEIGITTTDSAQTFVIDISAGINPFITIDWGIDDPQVFTTTGMKMKTYPPNSSYVVKISGSFTSGGNIKLSNPTLLRSTSVIPFIAGLSSFYGTFNGCTNLKSVPADLFRYNPQVSFSAFLSTFQSAGIEEIPAGLFRYNILASTSGFQATFRYTSITSVPPDTFRYNTLVSSAGFKDTFGGCGSLISIPPDLFRYNTAVSNEAFSSTFLNCTSLESVPADLFRYNIAASTWGFYRTFRGCNKIQLNRNIFFADGEETTRFASPKPTPNFTEFAMFTSTFEGTQGEAPPLWNCTFNGSAVITDCFHGQRIESVSNYGDIPVEWI